MPVIKRTDFLAALDTGTPVSSRCFLFFGERFLCKQAADRLQDVLLANQAGTIHLIDGELENPERTLSRLMSFSLLPGLQIYRVNDSGIFHSRTVASELWNKADAGNSEGRHTAARKNLCAMVQTAGMSVDSRSPLSEMSATEWKKLFGFAKPAEDLAWADRIVFENRDRIHPKGTTPVDSYIAALEKGLPAANLLILTTETVDKRQRLFTYLKQNGTVVDCSVTAGSTSVARKDQKVVVEEMMLKTVAAFDKKIDPQAVELFLDRVGFHPVAVVTETEKLVHYVGDRRTITVDDLNLMVAKNREDVLYELTDAFGRKQLGQTLAIMNSLLDQGVHSLALIATMRNYLRRLLVFRSLQFKEAPAWRRGMNARDFQNRYLPELKAMGEWKELLSGHPYALYMSFTKASEYSVAGLKRWLILLLDAEYKIKSSALPSRLILEELFISMLKGKTGPDLS
ncbi:DNA polymerase III subunit delta [Desulforhopalus singaporensis]|uniref:DNA-directed DNA polymerase n=1 Tax=Desulforhopalus singaporensis TaxID=91360 RepID=A0A1H0Q823_9BACT|nr:hypothetical protein [Desulforhopalus singaporensis]SDP13350.1 DNA polymerase III, delta subunit [Desulforhopalus singaporensis]